MKIDENKEFGLVNIAQVKKNKRIIETDHNALILDLDLKVINNKAKREEIYNLVKKHFMKKLKRIKSCSIVLKMIYHLRNSVKNGNKFLTIL